MEKDFKLIAVINSPGAALIVADLERLLAREVSGTPCFSLENTGYSGSFGTGYQNAMLKALETIEMRPRKIRRNSVNLIGLCIYQKYADNDYHALQQLFLAVYSSRYTLLATPNHHLIDIHFSRHRVSFTAFHGVRDLLFEYPTRLLTKCQFTVRLAAGDTRLVGSHAIDDPEHPQKRESDAMEQRSIGGCDKTIA